jgi:hypothetical protein
MPFKYAPPVAVLLAPLALLPRSVGAVLWNLGSVLFLLLALVRLPRLDPGPRDADGSWAALALGGRSRPSSSTGRWTCGSSAAGARRGAVQARDGAGGAGLAVLTKPRRSLPAVLPGPPPLAALAAGAAVVLLACALFAARVSPTAFAAELAAWRISWSGAPSVVTGPNLQGLPPHPRRRRLARHPAEPRCALARPALGGAVLRRAGAGGAGRRRSHLPDDHPGGGDVLPLAWRANFACLPRCAPGRGLRARAKASRASARSWCSPACSPRGPRPDRDRAPPGLRPWGLLGLLLVVVEFSAPRTAGPCAPPPPG